MRVTPQISSISQTQINLGNGVSAPVFNQQLLDTTVVARDGETVAIGGLITRISTKTENKVPILGDLPYLGTLFRYRTHVKAKQELLVIMTPHIVRTRAQAGRILCDEGRRMDWVLGDVVKTHGSRGMEPLFPPPPTSAAELDGSMAAPLVPALPAAPTPHVLPGPSIVPPATPHAPIEGDRLPSPRIQPAVPESGVHAPLPAATTATPDRPLGNLTTQSTQGATLLTQALESTSRPVPADIVPVLHAAPAATPQATPVPAAQVEKEGSRWRVLRWLR
jgi:general secretion pathway protein D